MFSPFTTLSALLFMLKWVKSAILHIVLNDSTSHIGFGPWLKKNESTQLWLKQCTADSTLTQVMFRLTRLWLDSTLTIFYWLDSDLTHLSQSRVKFDSTTHESSTTLIVTSYAHIFRKEHYMSSNPLVLGEKRGSWLREMTSIIFYGQFCIDWC